MKTFVLLYRTEKNVPQPFVAGHSASSANRFADLY